MKQGKSPNRNKNNNSGKFLRWILTIIIFTAVLGFEVYLFSRYSLWFKQANAQVEKTEKGNLPDNRKLPTEKAIVNEEMKVPIPSPPIKEFHPSPPPSVNSNKGQEFQMGTPMPPPTSNLTQEITSLLSPSANGSRDIVNPEALKLMKRASLQATLRGILELESKSDYYLAPGREKKILQICLNIKKNHDNKEVRNKLFDEVKLTFFSGLNEKQMKLVEGNISGRDKNPGEYEAGEGVDQIDYMVDECIRVLSGKVDYNPDK